MTITFSKEGAIGIVTINRPERMNAFTMAMREQLATTFGALAEDDDVRAVILTGAGRHFSTGADVGEMDEMTSAAFLKRMRWLHRAVRAMAAIRKPTIAAVDGACIGAGWSLALACDIAIATPRTYFSQIFRKVGYAPDAGAIWQLSRLVNIMRAKEIVYSGRRVDAAEALRLGLVLELVESETLMDRARTLATSLAEGPTLALGMAKRQFEAALAMPFDQFLELEFAMQPLLATTQDHREGVLATREKRRPQFGGR